MTVMEAVARAVAAAVVAWLLPVAFLGYIYASGPSSLASGEPDNAPFRAAGLLLTLSPLFLLLLVVYFLVVTSVLRWVGDVYLRRMLIAASLLSIALGIVS